MTSRRRQSRPSTTGGVEGFDAATRPRYLLATTATGVQLHAVPASGSFVVGRSPDCQVVLHDSSISRRHARIELGGSCRLIDLGSRNGTFFRGQRLAPDAACTVELNESFTLGSVAMLLLPPGTHPSLAAVAGSRLIVEEPNADDLTGVLGAVARAAASVLILGETGVGKDVLATRLHRLSGRKGPMMALNCAALSESLLENELFGHEKGAFTGAGQAKDGLLRAAAGGTIFLDEIGEMSAAVQAKMLRAIETRTILRLGGVQSLPIDVRFLAATHRDLLAESTSFRRDLYYRLAGFALYIPPLRERKSQIIPLANELLAQIASEAGVRRVAIAPRAAMALLAHDWPGNVRELRNVLMRAQVLAAGGDIDAPHVVFDQAAEAAPPDDNDSDAERARIVAALESCAGNQTRAARLLGISRTTLIQKIRVLDIPRPRGAR